MESTSAQPDIQRVAIAAAGGDRDALGELYESFATPIFRFLVQKSRSAQVADEVAGDVWLAVAKGIRQWDAQLGTIQSWLWRVAHNCLVDHWRREGRASLVPGKVAAAMGPERFASGADDVVLSRAEREELFAQVRDALSESQASALLLLECDQLSAAEVGAALGVPEGTVRQWRHRGLKHLREVVGTGKSSSTV